MKHSMTHGLNYSTLKGSTLLEDIATYVFKPVCGVASPPFLERSLPGRPPLGRLKVLCNLGLPTTYPPVTLDPSLFLYYSNLLSPLRSLSLLMRLIALALVPVALAMPAFALPPIAFERDLGNNVRRDTDPQTSLSKCSESSLSPRCLYPPSSVGSTSHFHQL
jgi:hypothetical protein